MFPYNRAKKIADDIVSGLTPFCQVINIVGSIRRESIEVKDIEIVCVPKMILTGSMELFGADTRKQEPHPEFYKTLFYYGEVKKGKTGGRYMQLLLKQGIVLDLFTPDPIDYWRIFAIRTGNSEYSRKVIAEGWRRIGWVGTYEGLRLKEQCEPTLKDGKTTWKCISDNPTLPPVWESEAAFFKWIGVTPIHPKYRNY